MAAKINWHRCGTKLRHCHYPLWTTHVSRYQKGKTNLDFTEATDSEWQWHQLGRMQVCTSLQTDNHTGTLPFLPPNQQRQSTEGTLESIDTTKMSRLWYTISYAMLSVCNLSLAGVPSCGQNSHVI